MRGARQFMICINRILSPLLSGILCGGVLLSAAAPSRADPPLANYAFPAGGQRGTAVALHVGLCNGNEECSWQVAGPGIEAHPRLQRVPLTTWFEGPLLSASDSQSKEDYPKDYDARLTIAGDAPLGNHPWRVWTSQGVTSAMKFVVGDLPEIVEDEIEGEPLAVSVTLPVTINGRIFPREDVDIWTFSATAGESITCEVNSARLGYPLQARLEVRDPAGRRIGEGIHNLGADVRVQFQAAQAGTYQVLIHDIRHGGSQSHVYRLTITQKPYVEAIYPLGGRSGTTVPFELSGQCVPHMPVSLPLTSDASPIRRPQSIWQRIPLGNEFTNPVSVQLDDLPEYLEPEGPDHSSPNPITLPAVLNGRIRRAGETDDWTIAAKQSDIWHLDLWASRLDSPLDSVLILLDSAGRELLRADDIGPGDTDSQAVFTVPADGVYTVRVADQFASRGGARFAYRLRITLPPAPDFQLEMPIDALALPRGAEASLKVLAKRVGGFADGITLQIDGLPPGVTAEPTTIGPNLSEVDIKFRASASAQIQLTHLRIRGEADIQGQKRTRTAAFPMPLGDPPMESLALMVALPAPFKYAGRTSIEYVPCGSSVRWHFRLDRGGFDGPIDIELSDRQFRHLMGMTAKRFTVPSGVTEFDYPVQVAPWTLLGRTGRGVIVASGTVTEPDGSKHVVSFSTHNDDDQVVVLASPPLLTVDTPRKALVARPGGKVLVPFKISRSARLGKSAVTVELVTPKHMRGLSAHAGQLDPLAADGQLELEFGDRDLGPWNAPVTVRATTEFLGQPTIAELTLSIFAE